MDPPIYATGRGEKDDEKKDWPNTIDETINFLFCCITWVFNLISSALFNVAYLVFLVFDPGKTTAETCGKWVAKAVSVQGSVQLRRVGETQWQQISLDQTFCGGDMVRVQDNSRADLVFANISCPMNSPPQK